MSEWKEYKLGEVADFIDYRGKTPEKTKFGIPLITAKIVKKGVIQNPTEFIALSDYDKWMTRGFPEVGDVVLTTEAPLGEVAQIKDASFALAQRIITLRGKHDKINNGYLKYFLQSTIGQQRLKERETGTTVTGIKSSELKKVLISAPLLPTQTAIAEILSSLDDKIELNNNINKELEKLAQTLFKQWFIEFEFPDENGEPYQSSGGEMIESELGMIPKDWEIGILDDILEVKGGTTPSTKDASFWDGIYHWTSPRDLSNLEFPLLIDTDKKITAKGLKKISSGLLPKGTLLLSSRAPIGYLAITEIETAINQGYIAINGKKEFSNIFILYWLKVNMHLVIERANGSTFLEISKTNFKQINCIIPDSTILHQYINQANATFEVMRNNLLENQELSTLRDTLLPKLISGELNVKDL